MTILTRRQFVRNAGLLGAGMAMSNMFPAWAQAVMGGLIKPSPSLSGSDINLRIGYTPWTIDGKTSRAVTINDTIPGPLIRLKEGQNVRLAVTNGLDEDTSIHWHGLLVPFQFDGVPGVSFPGIRPGETFVYEFPILQSGTYWYHSHSGVQEQEGHYGPIIIDPKSRDPIEYDREHIIVLSDFSSLDPRKIFQKLKLQSGFFNYQKQTLSGLIEAKDQPFSERFEWASNRMDPTDISDVTGSVYTFLVNGYGPEDNWTALFRPGERVRLRFINAAAMTIFNVRIPGLSMQVVQADGQNIKPVNIDEFQITVAETYDVIVQPHEDKAYTLVAEAVDRSGMARATLAPRQGMVAEVPPLRARPLASMQDMGMGGMDMPSSSTKTSDHAPIGNMAMESKNMSMRDPANAPQVKMGPGVQTISPMPVDRTGDPGQGLENVGHKVLVYRDLESLEPNPDTRVPSRTLELHLTGNMERFMWSFDGEKFSEVTTPIPFRFGERVRVTLVNDSMMSHPMHLHGFFFELLTGQEGKHPRKHTVNVAPGGKVTFDLTADAPGDWAFHCHMLYHMMAGMFRVVSVRPLAGATI
ncbi:MAG: copper resistance system multicopper oxidase [Rickettsiales bacterium]|nr:copper resistance system multicopper oxidase [Rickettsiales bacterium]